MWSLLALITLSLPTVILSPNTQIKKEPLPLSLPWGQTLPNSFQEIPGFKYWFGDMAWGQMIFLGDFQDLEAEVHLNFARKKIIRATLILGPRGLSDYGCRRTYLDVVKLLKKKYGNSRRSKVVESEIKEDLFYTTICTPIRTGLHSEEIFWETKRFYIVAALYGDDEDIFIEIDYVYKPTKHLKRPSNILKKL